MKKLLFILPIIFLLSSCGNERQSTQFFGYFDTVISVDGYFDSESDFEKACSIVEGTLKEYDGIFDIYENGELKVLNESRTLSLSPALESAIHFGIKAEEVTKGYCNIAMGSVLSLWHEARESDVPYLPSDAQLKEASKYTDISQIKFENEAFSLGEEITLDLGAIAKGIASDVLRKRLCDEGFDNLYVNLGGNVMVIGDKDGQGWSVGIQSPFDESEIIHSERIKDTCLVTSGVYQRFFEYDGKKYHHIISPDTLYPSELYLSVSVLYENGAWADALSTALFNMSIEDGKKVLDNFENISVIWITSDGEKVIY